MKALSLVATVALLTAGCGDHITNITSPTKVIIVKKEKEPEAPPPVLPPPEVDQPAPQVPEEEDGVTRPTPPPPPAPCQPKKDKGKGKKKGHCK